MPRTVVGGREFDFRKDEVIRTMCNVESEPIREHFVVIGEEPFPPKQVLAELTGWDRQSFTTMEATRALTRAGFTCQRRVNSRRPRGAVDPEEPVERLEDSTPMDRRLAAVESSITVMQEAIAGLAERVHEFERKGSARFGRR